MLEWIISLGFVLAGLLAGIIGEKVIFTKLKIFVANKKIPGSEIIYFNHCTE